MAMHCFVLPVEVSLTRGKNMFCPNCGKEYENDSKFCGACGFKFEEEITEADNTSGKIEIGRIQINTDELKSGAETVKKAAQNGASTIKNAAQNVIDDLKSGKDVQAAMDDASYSWNPKSEGDKSVNNEAPFENNVMQYRKNVESSVNTVKKNHVNGVSVVLIVISIAIYIVGFVFGTALCVSLENVLNMKLKIDSDLPIIVMLVTWFIFFIAGIRIHVFAEIVRLLQKIADK